MSQTAMSRTLEDSGVDSRIVGMRAVSLEAVFYVLLLALAAALRLVALDGVPRPEEIPAMLAAWNNTTSSSLALFLTQSLTFDLLGSSLVTARLLTGIAGVLLAMSPVLFRKELGHTRALLFTLLLVVCAPLLITARSSSPAVWTALFGVIALRVWLNHVERPSTARGIQAVIATVVLVFLGDPSGIVLALMLGAAAALALYWHAASADSDVDATSSLSVLRSAFAHIAWDKSLLAAALIVVAVTTGFMTNPTGLSAIGGLLAGIGTLFQPDSQNVLGVSLFYQLLLWGLAFAAILMNNRAGWGISDRFFLGWLLAGLIAILILPGLGSQHTVLIAFPLCGLVSGLAAYCFAPDKHQQMMSEKYASGGDELAMLMSPPAGRLILLLVVFALLFIFNVHLGSTSREFLQVEGGSLSGAISRMQQNLASADFRVGLLWSFISFMFLLVGFFLAGSIWGNRVAAQGYGLGLIAMLMITQLSAGWYVSEFGSDNAVEPWSHEVSMPGYALLERSMFDLSFRESQGFPLLPITVLREPAMGLTQDGLIGWMLRDQPNVRWVDSLAEAATAPIIIAPDIGTDPEAVLPDLGGSYVGQPFIITKKWSPDSLVGLDFLTWFLQRRVRVAPVSGLTVILWVRQDVFDSRPIEDLLD